MSAAGIREQRARARGCSTVALSSGNSDDSGETDLQATTPAELQELSEGIPSKSPVECIRCSRRWDNGTDFVETGLQELREEFNAIREGEREDPEAAEQELRYALHELSRSAESLLMCDPFEVLTYCPRCRIERRRD